MINSQIGYIICESDFSGSETKLTPKRINGKVVAEAILQTADEKNRNGRYYAEEELFPQLTAPRTVELLNAGYLRAECGHPLSKDLQRQSTIDDTRTCARFIKLWTEGKNVKCHVVGTNSELGKAFNADLEEGCMPAWSLRALGSVNRTSRGSEVKNLRLITWDNVIYPSHPIAYTQGLVTESASIENSTNLQRLIQERFELDVNDQLESNRISESGILIPMTNSDVLKFLQEESSNLKFVRECFDFAYSGIQTNDKGTKVILTTNEGDTMVINTESYVHNELMNYAKDFGIQEAYTDTDYSFNCKNIFDMGPQLEDADVSLNEDLLGLSDAKDKITKNLKGKDIAKKVAGAAAGAALFAGAKQGVKKYAQYQGFIPDQKETNKDLLELEDVDYLEEDGDGKGKWYDWNSFKGDLTGKDIAKNIGTAAGVGAAGVVGSYAAKKAINHIANKIEKKQDEKERNKSQNESFFDNAVDDTVDNCLDEFTRFSKLSAEQKTNHLRAASIVGAASLGSAAAGATIKAIENHKKKKAQNESFEIELDSVDDE